MFSGRETLLINIHDVGSTLCIIIGIELHGSLIISILYTADCCPLRARNGWLFQESRLARSLLFDSFVAI